MGVVKSSTQNNQIEVGQIFRAMPLTHQHWKAGLALFFSFAIEAWGMTIIILISDLVSSDFQLDSKEVGSLISSIFLGMIPGCLMWGKIADVVGRKKAMVASLGLYGLISLVSSLSPVYWILWWMRFVSGVVLAGVMVTAFPYFEELLPMKSRGRATVYMASGWPVGFLAAIGITYLMRDTGWHWILAASSLSGLWAFVVWAGVPESPYWAAGNEHQRIAKDALRRLAGDWLKVDLNKVDLVVEEYKKGSFIELFQSQLAGMTVLQILINFSFSWGYWALVSWMPTLLSKRGLSATKGYGFMALSAFFMFPGYIVASWLTGRYGRKKTMATFISLASGFGLGFAQSTTLTQMYFWNFGLSFFSLGAWGVWNTWMGELYPTEVRGVGYGVGVTAQRVANSLGPLVTGLSLAKNSSFSLTVSFIASFLAFAAICSLLVPETEGEILR